MSKSIRNIGDRFAKGAQLEAHKKDVKSTLEQRKQFGKELRTSIQKYLKQVTRPDSSLTLDQKLTRIADLRKKMEIFLKSNDPGKLKLLGAYIAGMSRQMAEKFKLPSDIKKAKEKSPALKKKVKEKPKGIDHYLRDKNYIKKYDELTKQVDKTLMGKGVKNRFQTAINIINRQWKRTQPWYKKRFEKSLAKAKKTGEKVTFPPPLKLKPIEMHLMKMKLLELHNSNVEQMGKVVFDQKEMILYNPNFMSVSFRLFRINDTTARLVPLKPHHTLRRGKFVQSKHKFPKYGLKPGIITAAQISEIIRKTPLTLRKHATKKGKIHLTPPTTSKALKQSNQFKMHLMTEAIKARRRNPDVALQDNLDSYIQVMKVRLQATEKEYQKWFAKVSKRSSWSSISENMIQYWTSKISTIYPKQYYGFQIRMNNLRGDIKNYSVLSKRLREGKVPKAKVLKTMMAIGGPALKEMVMHRNMSMQVRKRAAKENLSKAEIDRLIAEGTVRIKYKLMQKAMPKPGRDLSQKRAMRALGYFNSVRSELIHRKVNGESFYRNKDGKLSVYAKFMNAIRDVVPNQHELMVSSAADFRKLFKYASIAAQKFPSKFLTRILNDRHALETEAKRLARIESAQNSNPKTRSMKTRLTAMRHLKGDIVRMLEKKKPKWYSVKALRGAAFRFIDDPVNLVFLPVAAIGGAAVNAGARAALASGRMFRGVRAAKLGADFAKLSRMQRISQLAQAGGKIQLSAYQKLMMMSGEALVSNLISTSASYGLKYQGGLISKRDSFFKEWLMASAGQVMFDATFFNKMLPKADASMARKVFGRIGHGAANWSLNLGALTALEMGRAKLDGKKMSFKLMGELFMTKVLPNRFAMVFAHHMGNRRMLKKFSAKAAKIEAAQLSKLKLKIENLQRQWEKLKSIPSKIPSLKELQLLKQAAALAQQVGQFAKTARGTANVVGKIIRR